MKVHTRVKPMPMTMLLPIQRNLCELTLLPKRPLVSLKKVFGKLQKNSMDAKKSRILEDDIENSEYS